MKPLTPYEVLVVGITFRNSKLLYYSRILTPLEHFAQEDLFKKDLCQSSPLSDVSDDRQKYLRVEKIKTQPILPARLRAGLFAALFVKDPF